MAGALHEPPRAEASLLGAIASAAVYLRIAARALRGHLFRSFLTTLSIMIGAFSIVLMSSLAASGLATLSRGIEDLGGARLIMIGGKTPDRAQRKTASYQRGLTIQDRDVLFSAMPHAIGHSMYTTMGRINASADGGHFSRMDYVAVDGNFLDVFHLKVHKGRGLTDEDSREQARVCVIGYKTEARLFDGDALGKWLVRDRNIRCRVVGVLANEDRFGIRFGFDWLDVVLWPIGTIGGYTPEVLKGAEFLIRTDNVSANDLVMRVVNAILVERHHGVDDFELFNFNTFMDKFHQMVAIMEGIVGFIAGIALLVGGVGVMNMMLVSVSERVREIGVRKALGASPGAIRAQFLWEAMLLSGTGGGLGVAGGIGAALALGPLLRHFTPQWVNVIASGAATTALLVSLSIGLLFGFFPAARAAKLDAIAAMRR
jgi:putative ABC transport system permease protein